MESYYYMLGNIMTDCTCGQ